MDPKDLGMKPIPKGKLRRTIREVAKGVKARTLENVTPEWMARAYEENVKVRTRLRWHNVFSFNRHGAETGVYLEAKDDPSKRNYFGKYRIFRAPVLKTTKKQSLRLEWVRPPVGNQYSDVLGRFDTLTQAKRAAEAHLSGLSP